MLVKMIVIVLLFTIVGCLASGLIFLVRDKGHSDRTVKALTWRIALSILAFALLIVGYYTGLIQPHGINY
ncbi:MAG TPA: twin transmembrane helix small protein [Gammaproteobacteria bacterium]|jgi:hypothetical protein|nr:twin transmembrane helix small protein [Pseudomonadota bacterium]HEX2238800.1 twin transmembrane helix small protein [Gammaproteobacteria bacterium]HEX2242844.1 twin transmembrane helix small protein [Gammaproteobacteria bacterium]